MARFDIKNGFTLRSAGKLLFPKSMYFTDDEAELKELRDVFCPNGSAVEVLPTVATKSDKNPEDKTVDPNDDITLAKGVGAATAKKLAEKQITTFSGLKTAMTDKTREEEMKELLGTAYAKVLTNFEEKSDSPEVK